MGSEIEVVTKGNNIYTFKQWSSDSSGGVSGEAEWLNPSSNGWTPYFREGWARLPADSIKSAAAKELNAGLTTLVLIGAGIAVVGVVKAIDSISSLNQGVFGGR